MNYVILVVTCILKSQVHLFHVLQLCCGWIFLSLALLYLQVLLLMASSLSLHVPENVAGAAFDSLSKELRTRQQCIAEITEMIHVCAYIFTLFLGHVNDH